MTERRLFNIVLTTLCWCVAAVMFFACGDALYDKIYAVAITDAIVSIIADILGVLCTCKMIKEWNKE